MEDNVTKQVGIEWRNHGREKKSYAETKMVGNGRERYTRGEDLRLNKNGQNREDIAMPKSHGPTDLRKR